MENSLHYISVNHENHLIDAINQLRKRNELCDIILKCGNTAIAAHKLILSVSTPYFKSLVENKFQSNIRELKIDDVNAEAVQIIVEFFYTSAFLVDDVIVWTLLPAACRLQVEEIQNVCCDFLSSQLQLENCLRIHQLAASCLCSGLLKESTEFVKSNFDQIIEEEIFLELPVKEVVTHLKRLNDMGIEDAKILQAVKCWIIHSVDDRQTMGYLLLQEFSNLKEELEKFIPAEYQVPQEEAFNISAELIEPQDESLQNLSDAEGTLVTQSEIKDSNDDFSAVVKKEDVSMCHDVEHTCSNDMNAISLGVDACKLKKSQCNFCKQMISSNSMARHLRKHRGERIECRFCPATFIEKYELNMHEKFHINPFVCDTCGKRLTSRSGLRQHIQNHTEKRPITCDLCPMSFRTRQHYEGHRNSQHLKNKPFICTACDKAFAYQPNLARHKLGCGKNEKEFTCDKCGIQFKTKRQLDEHAAAKHSDQEIRCNCGKLYQWKRSYNRHRQKCKV